MTFRGYYESPIGVIEISGNNQGITNIEYVSREKETINKKSHLLANSIIQLSEYFACNRKIFDLPIIFHGTAFQQTVWRLLYKIPYGSTISYKELAIMLGDSKKARAVGMANNKNKLTIVVPCHRVIGKDKKLVGYGGGLQKKVFLLKLEGFQGGIRF